MDYIQCILYKILYKYK